MLSLALYGPSQQATLSAPVVRSHAAAAHGLSAAAFVARKPAGQVAASPHFSLAAWGMGDRAGSRAVGERGEGESGNGGTGRKKAAVAARAPAGRRPGDPWTDRRLGGRKRTSAGLRAPSRGGGADGVASVARGAVLLGVCVAERVCSTVENCLGAAGACARVGCARCGTSRSTV